MKKKTGDDWFPFWIDKWLFGSTRDEFTIEQCAVWVDFLALSSKDDGYIRANVGIPYPIKRLSGILNRPEKLIQQTIDRCLEPAINKLRLEADGSLYVVTHDEYELSKRHKRRLSEEDLRQNGHDVQKTDAKRRVEESRVDKNREEKKGNITAEQALQINKELQTVKGLSVKKCALLISYIRKLSIEFPNVDCLYEIKKKVAWWLDHPLTKRSNIHLQLRNWFIISQKGFDEAKKQHRVGKDYGHKKTKYPTGFLSRVYSTLKKQGKKSADYSTRLFDIDYYQARQLAIKYKGRPAEFIKFLEGKK